MRTASSADEEEESSRLSTQRSHAHRAASEANTNAQSQRTVPQRGPSRRDAADNGVPKDPPLSIDCRETQIEDRFGLRARASSLLAQGLHRSHGGAIEVNAAEHRGTPC